MQPGGRGPAGEAATATGRRRLFAGRSQELEVLEHERLRSSNGELRLVLVTGEAGIGKTALVGAFLEALTPGTVVLTSRAHAFGTSTEFGLWVEALERYLRTLEPATVARLAGVAAPELATLLRSVEGSFPGHATHQASSYRLVEGMVSLLAGVAARTPAVVFLDDAHLADSASWETLHFLARDRPALPMLVVAAARPDELADHPIAADVAFALEEDGLLRRLRLSPLGAAELEELVRKRSGQEAVPAAVVRWLEDRSQGNALFATGLIVGLLDRGGDLSQPSLTAVPEELGERVRARLRGLDSDAVGTLELLAALGSRTELADVTRVAGMAGDRVAVALENLVRRRLAYEDVSGPAATFEIAHPLVQDVIYESIGLARRERLHRKIGRTLLASGDLAGAASHLARSASPGDPEAVEALVAALRQAEERSLYRSVTAILAELVRLLPGGDQRWLDVLDAMDPYADWVLAHLAEDGVDDAFAAMRLIEPLADLDGDPRRQAIVQLRQACFASVGLGRLDDALRACEAAADLFAAAGDPVLALAARVESGFVFTLRGDHGHTAALARTLLPEAEALGHPMVTIHLMMLFSTQCPWIGEFEVAGQMEERGMALARASGNHYRFALLRNRQRLSLAHRGDVRQARALAAGSWDSPAAADALASECAIAVDWLAGDLEGALRAAAKSQVRNRMAMTMRQTQFLAYGARAAIDADRLEGVRELLDRIAWVGDGFAGVVGVLSTWASAALKWRLGHGSAMVDLVRAAQRFRDLGAPAESLYSLLDVAEAARDTGAPDAGRWAAAEASAAVQPVSRFPFHVAIADLVNAIASSDPARVRRACEVFDELGYRLFMGRAQLALGRALAPNDRRGAVEAMEAAVRTFESCGAGWHVSRAVEVLRAAGSRGRRAAAAVAGPAGLSRRELEVASLAAAGKTAREIAEAMFIGERTVETHLRNAYGKLGVRSKRELAQRAKELGLRT